MAMDGPAFSAMLQSAIGTGPGTGEPGTRDRLRTIIEEVLTEYMTSQGYLNAFESMWNDQLQV